MSKDNLDMWNKVCKTDPKHTKRVNQRGGYTSVDPQYQLQEATKIFGPYGMGFGFESIDFDYSQVDLTKLVLVKAVFFYVIDSKKSSFPVMNAWSIMQGSKVDADFAKKAETNTMSKALSKLGFSADVFMGQFDDVEYVSIVKSEKELESAVDKIAEQSKQNKEYQEKCVNEINILKKSQNLNGLEHTYKEYYRRAKLHNDLDQMERLNKVKDDLKTKLPK